MRTGVTYASALRQSFNTWTVRATCLQPATLRTDRLQRKSAPSPSGWRSLFNNMKPIYADYTLPKPSNWPVKQPCVSIWAPTDGGKQLRMDMVDLATTEDLDQELSYSAQCDPYLPAVEDLINYLIIERQVRPTAAHYEALVRANCDPVYGSVEYAQAVIEDLKKEGMPVTSLFDSALLQVLTVHPRRSVRERLVEKLHTEWTSIPDNTKLVMVAALLREGQIDAAQVQLQVLQEQGISIPVWIWVILSHELCARKDFDALMCLIYDAHDRKVELPRATLLCFLREAAASGHLPLVHWMWMKHVQPGFIRPDAECCEACRLLAVREGNGMLETRASALLKQLQLTAQVDANSTDLPTPTSTAQRAESLPPDQAQDLQRRTGTSGTLVKDAPPPEELFFDAKEALAKVPLPRFLNQDRRAHHAKYHAYLSYAFNRQPKGIRRSRP